MGIAIAALAHSAYTMSCLESMYCMGCSATNVCSSCFNWGSGSVGARSLASNTCTTKLTKTTTDAQNYNGTHTNSSNWAWSAVICKPSKYHQVDQSGGVAANYTSSCTSTLATGATAVANCKHQSVEKTSASAA